MRQELALLIRLMLRTVHILTSPVSAPVPIYIRAYCMPVDGNFFIPRTVCTVHPLKKLMFYRSTHARLHARFMPVHLPKYACALTVLRPQHVTNAKGENRKEWLSNVPRCCSV